MPGDPVVGSTILRRPAIQSPNFVTQVSGWTINADGSAEFNNLTIRGTFNGNDFILDASGFFLYSGTPAAGNLIFCTAAAGITADSFGNAIPDSSLAGATSFLTGGGSVFACNHAGGGIGFWQAATEAGPYTLLGDIGAETGSPGTFVVSGFTTLAVNALALITALTVSGSSSSAGLPNGQISGTSGTSSPGPVSHTHGPGSYAVTDGVHSHGAGSYQAS